MVSSVLDSFKDLGLSTVEKPKKQDQQLQQEQFLKLLTTQLTHQDPLKPMENGEFLGQMAQFSTVSGIQDLQKSFNDFAESISSDQALQAAGLVGRYISAPSDQALLSAGGDVSGEIDLPGSTPNLEVTIVDPYSGEQIRTLQLGNHAAGKVPFTWDGFNDNGELVDPGVYNIQVEGSLDGKNTQMQANIKSKVESVTMGSGSHSLKVNLSGLGPVSFNQIQQIL